MSLELAAQIKQEIETIKQDDRFLNAQETVLLEKQLDTLITRITVDLGQQHSAEAISCLKALLDLHPLILERSDDDSALLTDVFGWACAELGMLYENAKYPPTLVADVVLSLFLADEYGVYENIITHFKTALGAEGLDILRYIFTNASMANNDTDKIKRGLDSIAFARLRLVG